MPLFSLKSQTTGIVRAFNIFDLLQLLAGDGGINDEIILDNQVYQLSTYREFNSATSASDYRCSLSGLDFTINAQTHLLATISSIRFEDSLHEGVPILHYKIDEALNIHFHQNAAMDGITAIITA